jgi:hypothetical protein
MITRIKHILAGSKEFVMKCKHAVLVNLVYVIISAIFIVQFMYHERLAPFLNDFATYYYNARVFYSPQLPTIFDSVAIANGCYVGALQLVYNITFYRYLPSFLMYFYPFIVMPIDFAYVVFLGVEFMLTIVTGVLVKRIFSTISPDPSNSTMFLAFFLICPFQIENYSIGQVAIFESFVLVFALYCFLHKHDAIGALLLGFSVIIKPASYFVMFLLVIVPLRQKDWKSALKRIGCFAVPLLPDAIIFAFYPKLLNEFIKINMGAYDCGPGTTSYIVDAISFTNAIVNIFLNYRGLVMVVASLVMLPVLIWVIGKFQSKDDKLIMSFGFGMLSFFITQSSVWTSQLLYLLPFLYIAVMKLDKAGRTHFFKSIIAFTVLAEIYNPFMFWGLWVMTRLLAIIVGGYLVYLFVDMVKKTCPCKAQDIIVENKES